MYVSLWLSGNIHTNPYMHTGRHAYVHTDRHKDKHTYIHKCINAHMHTFMYLYDVCVCKYICMYDKVNGEGSKYEFESVYLDIHTYINCI